MPQDTEEKDKSLFEAPPIAEQERMVEAVLFASVEPVSVKELEESYATWVRCSRGAGASAQTL